MAGWTPGVRLQLRLKEAGGEAADIQGEVFAYDNASDTLALRAYLVISFLTTRPPHSALRGGSSRWKAGYPHRARAERALLQRPSPFLVSDSQWQIINHRELTAEEQTLPAVSMERV